MRLTIEAHLKIIPSEVMLNTIKTVKATPQSLRKTTASLHWMSVNGKYLTMMRRETAQLMTQMIHSTFLEGNASKCSKDLNEFRKLKWFAFKIKTHCNSIQPIIKIINFFLLYFKLIHVLITWKYFFNNKNHFSFK